MGEQPRKRVRAVRVQVGRRGYPVWVGAGLLSQAGQRLRQLRPDCERLYVVTSPRIWKLWGDDVTRGLKRAGIRSAILKLADGERNKRLQAVERLAEGLLARGADRGDLLAAVGGGVVGDVTGFLAASYMRGIGHVQIPTTLVAQSAGSYRRSNTSRYSAGARIPGRSL
jgi:3-dehydroquinate synthase